MGEEEDFWKIIQFDCWNSVFILNLIINKGDDKADKHVE